MCALCGVLLEEHWAEGEGGRRGRALRVTLLNRVLDHPMHLRNAVAVIQDAVQRGLHPKGDVVLAEQSEHDEPRSKFTDLTYVVPVVPAIVDTDAASTVTPQDIAASVAVASAADPTQPWTPEAGARIEGEHGPETVQFGAGGTVIPTPAVEG